jgi:hypothetical protein
LQESGLGFANWNEIVDAIDLNATVKQSLRSPTSPTSGGNSPINSMDSLKLQTPQESQQGSTANKRGSYIYRQEMDFEPNVRRTRRRSDPRTPVKRGQVPMPRSAGAISDGRYNANSVGIASDHQPPASCPSTPRTSQDHVRFADTREGSISINANVYDTTAIDENVMASAKEDQKMAHAAMTKHIPAQIDTDVAQTAEPVTVKYSPLPRTPGKSHAHGSTRGRELVGVTDETVSPSSAVRVVLQGDSDTHQLSPKYSNDNPGLMRSETMVLISPRPEATEKCKNPMHDAKSVATGSDEGSTHDSTSPYVVEHRRVMGIHPLVADRGVETGRLMTSSTMQSITPIYHRDFAYEANDANNDYQN